MTPETVLSRLQVQRPAAILPKFGLRPDEAAFALGSSALLAAAVGAGWLTPVIQQHKLTLYDVGDIARVWARLRAGESPFPARK